MKCFYHSADLDGHCSGAIAKLRYPDCELIPINYGDEFPWDNIVPGEGVIMVDFSLQPFDGMLRLASLVSLTWIDHHASAIREYEERGLDALVVLDSGRAACELFWAHLHPGELVPTAVRLLGRYDVWDHSDERTLPFQYGLRLEDTNPENQELWNNLFTWTESNETILSAGKTVLKYIGQANREYVNACAFTTELDGLRCIAVNRMRTNSQVFDAIWDEDKHDAMLTFGWRNGRWTVSLYTYKDDVDVSEITKARGGGGHKNAAGFQCDELPFELR